MKTILCYGDSNTHGTLPIGYNFLDKKLNPQNHRLPRERRWPGILQKEMGENYYVIEEGLNGRTTVFNDPVEGEFLNGLKYLTPCLKSHSPIDLVILMLGTNDLKARFSLTAFEIALSIEILVKTIQSSETGPGTGSPKILLLCPPPLGKLTHLAGLFSNGPEESKKLALYFDKVAKMHGCHFMDVGKLISSSVEDGIHYYEEDIKKLGYSIAAEVKKIL